MILQGYKKTCKKQGQFSFHNLMILQGYKTLFISGDNKETFHNLMI